MLWDGVHALAFWIFLCLFMRSETPEGHLLLMPGASVMRLFVRHKISPSNISPQPPLSHNICDSFHTETKGLGSVAFRLVPLVHELEN